MKGVLVLAAVLACGEALAQQAEPGAVVVARFIGTWVVRRRGRLPTRRLAQAKISRSR
jgi:hypothetical protein